MICILRWFSICFPPKRFRCVFFFVFLIFLCGKRILCFWVVCVAQTFNTNVVACLQYYTHRLKDWVQFLFLKINVLAHMYPHAYILTYVWVYVQLVPEYFPIVVMSSVFICISLFYLRFKGKWTNGSVYILYSLNYFVGIMKFVHPSIWIIME